MLGPIDGNPVECSANFGLERPDPLLRVGDIHHQRIAKILNRRNRTDVSRGRMGNALITSCCEILLPPLRLPTRNGNIGVRRFDETPEHLDLLLEILHELFVLLVAPSRAESGHLPLHDRHLIEQLAGELLELMSETTDFARIDDSLRHEEPQLR